jgi:hypothetical protein
MTPLPSNGLCDCVLYQFVLAIVLAIVLVGIVTLWLLVYGCTSAHITTQDV